MKRVYALGSYLLLWIAMVSTFWMGHADSFARAVSMFLLWILIPIGALLASVVIGADGGWSTKNWLLPAGFALSYVLAYHLTLHVEKIVVLGLPASPTFDIFLIGLVLSLTGLLVGRSNAVSYAKTS